MTALHRVKAYFGMVPADELDSYDGYGDYTDADGTTPVARRPLRPAARADRYGTDGHEAYAGPRYDETRHGSDRSRPLGTTRYAADRYGSDRYGEALRHRYEDRYDERYESSQPTTASRPTVRATRAGRSESARAEEPGPHPEAPRPRARGPRRRVPPGRRPRPDRVRRP